jgi:VCBS repeat-containing protein
VSDTTIANGNGTYDLTGSQGGTITVGNGNDTVVVTGGSDETITVGNGTVNLTVDGATGDTIKAGNGNDTVTVSGGSDNTITVGNGNETVVASGDQGDTITVGNGNVTVDLGANDTVTVGKGNDTLVLPPSGPTLAAPASITVLEDQTIGMGIVAALSATAFGQETIYGFRGNDKLEVSTAQFANFATLLADAKQVGQNTVISADPADTITLENVQLSSLKSSNVVFTSGGLSATLSLTISGLPADATLSSAADPGGVSYNAATQTWSVAAGALPDLTLHAGEVTTATLTVTATDSATGASLSETIALTVDPVAPTLTAPASLSVVQGQTVALNISETPYDARDVVSLTISGVPADATLSAGTHNADGTWSLTPAQLSGLTLTAGAATVTSLTVTATNTLGITASTSDPIALTVTPASTASISVAVSVAGGGAVQQGQSLLALATITGDAADLSVPVTYQWQSSSDGGQTWTNVAATAAGTFGGVAGSLYQLTEADEGKIFRAEASITDDTGHLVSANSQPTVSVADVTPEITVPFSYAVDNLTIVKNGTQIYQDTFNQAPPASPTILSNGTPTPIAYLTLGGTWTESGGKAVVSSAGVAPNTAAGGVEDFALLNTNTDPSSNLGLKLATNFTVSSTFDLAAPTSGSYGMELTDGTPTHGTDQLERLIVARVNGNSVVELVQADLTTSTQTVVASHTLTSAELAGNTQIELQLTHAANAQTVSGSFELIDNGTVTSTVNFAPTASIFTNGVDWTRVDVGAFTGEGVGLNVAPGQAVAAGETLNARAAANDADATIHYQWQESSTAAFTTFTDIGTDSSSYLVQAADAGSFIRVVATTSDPDSGQSATATSQVTGAVHLPSATSDFAVVAQDDLGEDSTSPVSGNVLSNDAGAIAGDVLSVTAVNGSAAGVGNAVAGTYGTLRLNPDGSYSYQLADGQANVDGLSFGQTVTDTFAYTATDSFGTSTSSTLNIVINPHNDAPVIVAAGTTATGAVTASPANQPETVHTISGTVAFTDENLLDTHAPAIFVPAPGNYGNMSVVLDNDSTGGATGTATWTYTVSDAALDPLAQGQTATDTFDVLIPDPNGGIASQPVTITLTGSNDTPVVQTPDQNLVFTQGSASAFTASGTSTFTDADLTDTHTVSASLQSATLSNGAALPEGLTSTLASALSATLQSDDSQFVPGQYGWNFALNDAAVDFLVQGEVLNLTYQIDTTDPFGGVGVQDVNVAITGVTPAPTVTTPTITGTAQEGQTLTASASSGSSGASVTYAWYSSVDGYTNIIGTGASYLVGEGDEGFTIEARATATSSNGLSVSATSTPTGPVLDAAPTVTTPIIAGIAQEGQTLTASASAGQADNTLSYAWYSSADNFTNPVGTGATYLVKEADEGFTLEAKATVANDDGASTSALSTATGPVLDAAPTVTTPIIVGIAQEGQTLTASASAGQADNALSYAWYSSADNFTNPVGTGATYLVKEADEGFTIEAKATVTNDDGASVTAVSAPTSAVIDNASVALSVSVIANGAVQQGETLIASATVTGDADDLAAPISYQWQSSADGGLTWTNVAATTTGNINGVLSSAYQLREGDEGKLFRAVASITDETGQVVSATSAPTTAVADVPPVLSMPFSYAVDDFKVVKNGSLAIDDNFSNGPPIVAGSFAGTPVIFATNVGTSGSTWSEQNGKAIMSSSGAIAGGQGALVQAILATNTSPQGTGAGQSNGGLKEDSTFTVSTTFDLQAPVAGAGGYGIMLTNTAPGVPGSEVVELEVQRSASGTANIVLLQVNQATSQTTVLANQVLTAAQMTGNTQIELDLAHNTANSSTITGSFELFNNGTQTAATTFAPTTPAHAFNNQSFTRAAIFATASAAAQISGTAEQGQTLTARVGVNDSDLALAYQWQRSTNGGSTWSSISGATSATYVVQASDENAMLRVAISATDPDNPGSVAGTVFSSATATVIAGPTVTTPVISGVAQEGQTLTASATAGVPGEPVTYTWYSSQSGFTVAIGTGATYTVNEADEGNTLNVTASVTDATGATASASSVPTGPVLDAPPTVTTPVINGVAQEGQMLFAFAGAGQPDNQVTYAWFNSTGAQIGTGANYQVQESDEGTTITVVATATNEQGATASQTSAPTAVVLDAPPQFAAFPTISNPLTPAEGQTLTASATPVDGDNTVAYAWYSSVDNFTTPIGTGSSYTLQESDEAHLIEVKATITNADGATVTATSNATGFVNDPPATVDTPTITGIAQEGQVLSASANAGQDADGSPLVYLWYSSRDGFVSPIGAGSSYLVQEADEGFSIGVRAIAFEDYSALTTDGMVTSALAVSGVVADDGADNDPAVNPNAIVNGHQYVDVDNSTVVPATDVTVIGNNDVIAPSSVTVTLAPSATNVVEGDGQNIVASLATFGLTGNGDTITGSSDTINAAANTSVNLDGTSNTVSGDGVTVNVSDAFVTLTGAGEQVTGQHDIVALAGNASNITIDGDAQAILYTPSANPVQLTLNGTNDVVSGPTNTRINLQDGASLIVANGGSNDTVTGNNVTVNGQVNGLTLTGSNDTVEGFSNTIDLADGSGVTLKDVGGFTTIFGNNEQINVADPNPSVVLMGTGDTVTGDNALVQMPNAGSATLLGNNDQVLGSGEILYVDNATVSLAGLNGGPTTGTTVVGNNDTINANAVSPSATTHLTVQGTNDTVVGNNQSITIADGASVELPGVFGDAVTFGGPTGTLVLDQSATFNAGFQNSISGFGAQDQLDLRDLAYDPVTSAASFSENAGGTAGTLTVTNGGSSASMLLYGDFTTASFALASDGHGGTLVTDPPAQQTQLAQSHA